MRISLRVWSFRCLLLAYLVFSQKGCGQIHIADITSAEAIPVRNIVLICLDTVRYDSFWAPESLDLNDPLAPWNEKAVRFRKTQSTAPWTVPAIASVMTGLYPSQHGAGAFNAAYANLSTTSPTALPQNIRTLAAILGQRGYETQGFTDQEFVPATKIDRGFGSMEMVEEEDIKSKAVGWLQNYQASGHDAPFFLYLHFMRAHTDVYDTNEHVVLKADDLPVAFRHKLEERSPAGICRDASNYNCLGYDTYVAAILKMRAAVVEVLCSLKKADLLKSTVVIVFSDHGEEFSEHALEEKENNTDPRGNYGLGHGHSLYQSLLHVPMLLWHPDFRNIDVTIPVSLVDVLPTLLDLVGIEHENLSLPGRSLADVTRLNTRSDFLNRELFSSGIAYGAQQTAVLKGDWKRVFHASGNRVMFNLKTDSKERRPLMNPIGEYLDSLIDVYNWKTTNAASIMEPSNQELQRLQSLGYLTGR